MIREHIIQDNNNPQPRPAADPGSIYGDELNEALYTKLQEMAEWVAPCTFKRTNKAPIDSKSCFASLYQGGEVADNSVESYINDQYSTAYPGQVVAVTDDFQNTGLYVLLSQDVVENNETVRKLVPVRLGTKQEINAASASAVMNWLGSDGNEI